MTWEQKLMALKALCPTSLKMRKPGDWYVDASGREIKINGGLLGAYGNGDTPQAAVEDDFRQVAESEKVVVLDAYGERRCELKWNGYMWEAVV